MLDISLHAIQNSNHDIYVDFPRNIVILKSITSFLLGCPVGFAPGRVAMKLFADMISGHPKPSEMQPNENKE